MARGGAPFYSGNWSVAAARPIDKDVRTTNPPVAGRDRPARRLRRRFGYDHRWWGEPPRAEIGSGSSYWATARKPLPCLVFVLPMLVVYEAGVLALGGPAGVHRAGADAWMRGALATLGLTDRWFPPLALVVALLAWQAAGRRDWRFRPATLLGMALECPILAVALIGLSRLVDLGLARLDGPSVLASGGDAGSLLGYLGAGIYEEALFRLALIPALFAALRLIQAPTVMAGTAAVTGSALLFSLAHHAGAPGEAFTWFAFIFRWVAGVFFAWVFLARGFGVAVGTHAAYDLMVGRLGWHF